MRVTDVATSMIMFGVGEDAEEASFLVPFIY